MALANAQVQIKSLQTELRKQENLTEELQTLVNDEEEKRKGQAEKHQVDLEKLKKVSFSISTFLFVCSKFYSF